LHLLTRFSVIAFRNATLAQTLQRNRIRCTVIAFAAALFSLGDTAIQGKSIAAS